VQHRYVNNFEEIQMNREFKPTPATIRVLLAAASLLASLLVASSMATLADHYHAELQLTSGQLTAVAQR
jgi:multidrug resistance efflux pump